MSTRKKTVLRTIRLTPQIDSQLQKDAKENDVTVNSIINKILTKRIEWDTHIEKFKFVSISRETFQALLELCNDREIEKVATIVGNQTLEAITLFWYQKLNLETILKTLSTYSKYSGLLTSEIEVDEGNYSITFHHDLGKRWSIFLKCMASQFLKTALGIEPKIQTSDNVVVFSFYAPPLKTQETQYSKKPR
jgi:hypothetical protein